MTQNIFIGILALVLAAHIYVRYQIVKILRNLQKQNIQIRPMRLYKKAYREEQLAKFPDHAEDINLLYENMKKSIIVLVVLLIVAISSFFIM